ncbi:MAG: SAM-dependent methyltransferase, partial [Giesbergeria sp.]|nr:SAM-dependent methyltransferase [Giesbergeria sp.]
MTSLEQALIARIAAGGPMPLASYMAACLLDPAHGYYTRRDPFGAAGDFTTSPEISQMFGELLGLALAQSWLDQGTPPHIVLAEPGPGRGTLMADATRAMAAVPGLHEAISLHLIEASPLLRRAQAERLGTLAPCWHEGLETLPEGPLYLIANEFLDALPIRQFQRQGAGWAERQVGAQAGRLALGLAPPVPLASLAHRLHDTRENLTRVEDILRELNANLEKLEKQAEVAARYNLLQGDATLKQHQQWFLKRADAEADQEKVRMDGLQAVNDLEARMADLRHIEAELETIRQAHYAAGDQVNQAQGKLYEATAEVGRLEAEIRYVVEGRQRVEQRLVQLAEQIAQWQARREEADAELERLAGAGV